MKSTLLTAILFACLASAAGAETVYKWVDAKGQVNLTDLPPRAGQGKIIAVYEKPEVASDEAGGEDGGEAGGGDDAGSAGSGDAGPESLPPPSREDVAAVQAEVAKVRAERCKAAQQRYKTYIESQRLYRKGADGQRIYLTDAELTTARANAKREMDENCR